MPSFKQLDTADVQTLKIPVANDQSVTLKAALGRMTGDMVISIAEATNEGEQYKMVCTLMAQCIDEWDITQPITVKDPVTGDETTTEVPMPITEESIVTFPVSFVMACFEEMQNATNPPKGSETTFGNG